MDPIPTALLESHIKQSLAEDLGVGGDISTLACVPSDAMASANIVARQAGCLAGSEVAAATFTILDPAIQIERFCHDGDSISPNQTILAIKGRAQAILTGERTALNYLTHLSGIATATAAFVKAIEGTTAKIVCTRKTTPGLRALEKYAVRMGGGQNHRFSLDQAVLIKDNHIAFAGGVSAAIQRALSRVGHTMFIEVEVDSLDQLQEALRHPIHAVLLDNMDAATLREAFRIVNGKVITEASGGVRLETVRAIAETGVDLISVGWITASAPNLDLALDWV